MTTRRMTMFSVVVALGTLMAADGVLARSAGHPGATGRDNGGGRCNRCHSPDTYDGAQILLDDEFRKDCYTKENGAWSLQSSFWVVPYGAAVNVHLVATDPPAGTADNPDTPADEGVVGLFCPEGSTCGATVAGFAIEVDGAEVFIDKTPALQATTTDGQKQAESGDPDSPSQVEVDHSQPKAFANGEVTWTMTFNTPNRYAGVNPPNQSRLWAGVNVCNGNGAADQGDITAYTNTYIYYDTGNGQSTAPSMNCTVVDSCTGGQVRDGESLDCACVDGQELVDGECVEANACGCNAASDDDVAPMALVALAMSAALVRRRRGSAR